VIHAEDTALQRPVALKLAREELVRDKPHYRKLFLKEARHLALLEHPNVVPLYEYGEAATGPVLVLRYVENDLSRYARKQAEDLAQGIATIAHDLAASLDHCARNGIAHRDLKPDNVLVDKNGHAYLTDFGLAARFDDAEKWQEPVGTRPFLSPEQLLGDRVTSCPRLPRAPTIRR